MDTITALIAAQVRTQPQAPALVYEGERLSYATLDEMGRRAATGLAGLGVGRGDRVALWLPNMPAYLALWLGCARLGAIAVAVNTRFRSREVGDIVSRSGAKVLAMWPGFRSIPFLDLLAEVEAGALERLEAVVLYDEGGERPGDVPDAVGRRRRTRYADLLEHRPMEADHAAPDLGCNIFTTSGTTKAPKFVLHSQASITRHARAVADGFGYRASAGGVLQALPLCGVFGFCQATAGLAAGRPLAVMSAFDAERAADLIDELAVEHLNGTDDLLGALLDVREREIAYPSVRTCGFAAFAAEPEEFMRRAEARGLNLVGLYGMSEVQAFFARQPLDAPSSLRQLGGGLPVDPRATVRVTDPDTREVLEAEVHGEIEVRGPSRMSGYFGNPEATAETLTEDGYVRTGDLGYLAEGGRFVYLARIGDVLRLGGFLVSPVEIEAHLNEHPDVTGAQVVGIRTPDGPRPVGFVTLHRGAVFDEGRLRAHCLDGLAKFKAPARIFEVPEFPTTPSANGFKIQRAKLREMAERDWSSEA